MLKKVTLIIITIILISSFSCQVFAKTVNPGEIYEGNESIIYRNTTVFAPAVASTENGYVGVISTITVTIQSNGSGRVFVDTLPLTQVDMQGSARLAVKVASRLVESDINCDTDPSEFDYFFVVRTDSPIIGGPSAGAIMTVATISLLENWNLSNTTIMTGMINPDGSIGPIGGILQKIDAAYSVGADTFLIPKGQGTYTEMVTTVETDGIWRRTVTTPVTRNVSEYAENNYDMQVYEVAEVNDALQYFTGHRIEFMLSDQQITTEDYLESMQPLASSLITQAEEAYENATDAIESVTIPNYPYSYRTEINEIHDSAQTFLKESKTWYSNNLYYTSTSKSFQSLISSRFVSYAAAFFDTEEETQYLEDLISEAQSYYENASDDLSDAEIKGFISLQSVGAAQERVSDANTFLESSIDAYQNSNSFNFNLIDFIYNIAFSIERSRSAGWWLGIGEYFNEMGDLDNATVENIALEYIEEASQASIYTGVLLSEIGSAESESSQYYNEAESLIVSARNNLDNGFAAAAFFQSLEALARANLALEIIGSTAEEKIDLASERASSNIAKSRDLGIEPVLAVSYYEYAESLANESNYEAALEYYKISGMIAGALGFSNTSIGSSESKFIGIPETQNPKKPSWLSSNFWYIIGFALIGGIAGLGVGLILAGLANSGNQNSVQQASNLKTNEYRVKQKKEEYPESYIPKSIKDYYNKKK